MKIDPDKCISCLECIDFCTMKCILEGDETVYIDQDECVECSVCLRADVCPVDAIYMPEEAFQYPRSIRREFSDPGVQYPTLKQGGRGTEEMKTNDVTGRYRRGEYGMALEFGRPGTGTRISEIEKVLKVLLSMEVEVEENNPVFLLLKDKETGVMKPEVLQIMCSRVKISTSIGILLYSTRYSIRPVYYITQSRLFQQRGKERSFGSFSTN